MTQMTPNTLLMNATNGVIRNPSWEQAQDVVDYPVWILNAFYQEEDGSYVNANGETNTGRDKHFNLVVVDKNRTGDKQAISAVTGQYGTVNSADLYRDLQAQLDEAGIKAKPVEVYVTGNGGAQTLTVVVEEMMDLSMTPDALVFRLRFSTSVDGTKAHSLFAEAYNSTGNFSIPLGGTAQNVSARHTTTIKDRTVDFVPHFTKLFANWNDTIVPVMALMFESKYSRSMAMALLNDIAEEAKIGERHREDIRALYESDRVRTNDTSDSMYRIAATLNQYMDDEMEDKRDLRDRFKEGVSKSINKRLKNAK